MSLGTQIKIERVRRGMMQRDLVAATGISQHYLSLIERDKVLPRTDVLIKIADALKVTLDELVERNVKVQASGDPIVLDARHSRTLKPPRS